MTKVRRRIVLAGSLAALALLAAWGWRPTDDGPTAATPDVAGWDVPRMAEHLRSRGLAFRLIPGDEPGVNAASSAYLTTTAKTWRELNALPKVRERIGDWQGTLHCERVNQPGARALQIQRWGDCCLEVGPFVFFGDPALLARVRAALRPPGSR
jgi:hypothetical protein